MKILVIEDERIVLKAIEFKLAREGYDVLLAVDGKEGEEMILTQNPDLIISDIMMPYVNGLEIISYVRIKLERNTPLVMLSAIGQEDTVVKALEMGADDYITKPFSPNELLLRVKKLLIKLNR